MTSEPTHRSDAYRAAVLQEIGLPYFSTSPDSPGVIEKQNRWSDVLIEFANRESSPPDIKASSLLFLAEIDSGIYFSGLKPTKNICNELRNHNLEYHWLLSIELCEELIDLAFSKKIKTHKQRRHCLDQAIKRLLRLQKEAQGESLDKGDLINHQTRLKLALAKAYYRRGKIIRPKGFSVPAKKVETLQVADDLLKELTPSDTTGDAKRLRAMVHTDLAALQEDSNGGDGHLDILRDATATIADPTICDEEEIGILLARAEAEPAWAETQEGKSILAGLTNNPTASPLSLGRAKFLLGQPREATTIADEAAKKMAKKELPFSHEDWRLLVGLLAELKQKCAPGIDAVIVAAWEKAQRLERQTANNLHVRWYWSRQRDLYDLAFHATGDLATKAKIADSLKSRPALHLKLATDLGLAVEREEMGLMDRYLPDLTEAGNLVSPQEAPQAEGSTWHDLPKPWIAVHLYLSNGFGHAQRKKQGYALIQDSNKSGAAAWTERTFDYLPLWSTFTAWQETYQEAKSKAAPLLKQLCEALGKEMGFLFYTDLFPAGRPVVFIPHNFLHRMPLHMALMENKDGDLTAWLQTSPSSYLPAWWLYGDNQAERSRSLARPPRALVKWPSPDAIVNAVRERDGEAILDATKSNLLDLSDSPQPLVLYCHGHGHPTNPFASSLDLIDQLTVLDTLQTKKLDLRGTPIFLGACETDLVPPLTSALDEHLSFSFALLQKGAPELLGTLWEVMDTMSVDLLARILDNNRRPLAEGLWAWGKDKIKPFLRMKNPDILYHIAPFRALGLTDWREDSHD